MAVAVFSIAVYFAIAIYFFMLAAFFWLNVMCYDIWWTFSGNRGITTERMSIRRQFLAYCSYAFGIPLVLTIILVSLEFSGLEDYPWLPYLRLRGCFLVDSSKYIYLYTPIVVLWFADMTFFILTLVKIIQIKRQTSVIKRTDSARHVRNENDRQRFCLYFKLFLVMGFNWVLEVISAGFDQDSIIIYFMDAYNVLIGLFIFIIFVCKRKVFELMKKRYNDILDQKQKQRSTTTSSTRIGELVNSVRKYYNRRTI